MKLTTIIVSLVIATAAFADNNHQLDINTVKPGAAIPSTLYGIFLEDINFAADGGLYAEMVKNRSFEYPQHLMGWKTYGDVTIRDDGPFDRNPHYVRLSPAGHPRRMTALENEGYFGVSVEEGKAYSLSFWARCPNAEDGDTSVVRIELFDYDPNSDRQDFASKTIAVSGSAWKKYHVKITSPKTSPKAALRLILMAVSQKKPKVITDLEHISMFPVDTWKGREGGMRRDLAQALYDLHPGVFRFPGGCIVEGTDLATRYQWKNTIGPVENRPLNENRWQFERSHRYYADYWQSLGLGFFEYFQLCEDFGCEPLPVLSCGLACQFQNTRHMKEAHVPLDSLQSYIQDAIDLVEFANGDTSSTWGRKRAEMGHPKPFNLKYIAIGNEQWDEQQEPLYSERFRLFVNAMRKACPNIKIIGSMGPNADGWKYDLLKPRMREMKANLVDEHFYKPEQWFLSQAARYDNYDRRGPKIFAGEYACHGKGKKFNRYESAICEAAFMTGIERNADVVRMATYAPLFAHVEGWQWRPDLIWFDNLHSVRTTSYYVQQLFSLYKGTRVLQLREGGRIVAGLDGQDSLYASAVIDDNQKAVIVKVVNAGTKPQQITLNLQGKKKQNMTTIERITLLSNEMDADNSLQQPGKIIPHHETEEFTPSAAKEYTMEAKSFSVFIIK